MKLNEEARTHWTKLFHKVLDEGPDASVTRLLLRMEEFAEEMEEDEIDDGVDLDGFDWGKS